MKKYNLDKFGCVIEFDRCSFYLSPEDIYSLLIKLKKNPDWNKRIEKILNSDIKTDVGRGSYSFPFDCNSFSECEETYCNADTLNNGYAYRMS